MLRPFLPFRAKPLKKPIARKAFVLDLRTDPDDVLVTVKATRLSVEFARPGVAQPRGSSSLANGAARADARRVQGAGGHAAVDRRARLR